LVLLIIAYTLSSTKLEIRGGWGWGRDGGRNDPSIVCTYEFKKDIFIDLRHILQKSVE
jgi:hypothetical protein